MNIKMQRQVHKALVFRKEKFKHALNHEIREIWA